MDSNVHCKNVSIQPDVWDEAEQDREMRITFLKLYQNNSNKQTF